MQQLAPHPMDRVHQSRFHLYIEIYANFSYLLNNESNLPLPSCLLYWATSIDMLVPRGHVNITWSVSQTAFWYVLKVADSSAVIKISKWKYVHSCLMGWNRWKWRIAFFRMRLHLSTISARSNQESSKYCFAYTKKKTHLW